MIQIGNILNNQVLFPAEELRQHLQNGGNPPHVIFGQAILACRIHNMKKGEFVITLQIQGIGLDDVAGAQVRVQYTSSNQTPVNIVVRMGWQHLIKNADLSKSIYLTVLSIPDDAINRQTIVEKLRSMSASFRARKVKKGGNLDLGIVRIYLQLMSDGAIRFCVQTKEQWQQSMLTGMTLNVSCYGLNRQPAAVQVTLDDQGYTANITGVSKDYPVSVTFA